MTIQPAQDHPEFAQEQRQLRLTLGALEALLQYLAPSEPGRREEHAGGALYAHYGSRTGTLRAALPAPYFGRIDYAPEGAEQAETYYLGRVGFNFDGQQVLDWQSPVASLFYLARPGQVNLTSPEGDLKGQMLLKRSLGIRTQALETIVDEYDLRQTDPARPAPIITDPEDHLRAVLADKHEAGLHDIVPTIQGEQYDLIQASPKQALLIQGAAGSGKTSIALHRLAYLLYPANGTGIEAARCLIFGQNRLFLHHIAAVLPDLGIDDIPQVTFAEWSLEQMGLEGYRLTDKVLDTLVSPAVERGDKITGYRRSLLRNSRHMGDLLKKYVKRRRTATWPEDGFSYQAQGPLEVTVRLTPERIAEAYAAFERLPLTRHRERFVQTLTAWLEEEYDESVNRRAKELAQAGPEALGRAEELREAADRLESLAQATRTTLYSDLDALKIAQALEEGMKGLRQLEAYHRHEMELAQQLSERLESQAASSQASGEWAEQRRLALSELAAQLIADIDRGWPPVDVVSEYYRLVSDQALLGELAEGILPPDDVKTLLQTDPVEPKVVDHSDLPGLLYLHLEANGTRVPLYDHVIIDEAQDVSRLQFETVRRFSRNGSFTILGDLAQSIHAYRGIGSWDEVKEAFADAQANYHEITRGYRTTFEIATFANEVQRATSRDGRPLYLAEPFERHGAPPGLHPLAEAAEKPAAVAGVVGQLREAGYQHIAIIAKTVEDCSLLASGLKEAGLADLAVALVPDYNYTGGLVLLPVHLAKGVEFEAALVVDADEAHYPATAFDGRLLHTALTRALHVLHVFWVQPVSFHLEQVIKPYLVAPQPAAAGQA